MSKTALLIIDHGSRKQAANHMLFDMVKLVRYHRPGLLVLGAHMELALPSIPDGVKRCIQLGATHIIALPYMLSPGRHATRDIPQLITDALAPYPSISFTVTNALGIDDQLATLILKRAGL